MLIEALIGILIFSIGVLAMVGLQAAAIKSQSDAKYRADASYLANQIVAVMWVDTRANLPNYQHRPAAGGAACNPTGANSASANVTNWLNRVAAQLPSATNTQQQIIIGAGNQVTVVLCWKAPEETTWHNYRLSTYIN